MLPISMLKTLIASSIRSKNETDIDFYLFRVIILSSIGNEGGPHES